MKTPKHTQGPWRIQPDGTPWIIDPNGLHIAKSLPENLALIAAAPEMLEALQKVLVFAIHLKNHGAISAVDCDTITSYGSEAIRKARGE